MCLPDLCEHLCGMGLWNKCRIFTMIFRETESEGYCGPVGTPSQIKKQNRSSVQHSPCTAQSHRPPLSVMRPKKTTARKRLMKKTMAARCDPEQSDRKFSLGLLQRPPYARVFLQKKCKVPLSPGEFKSWNKVHRSDNCH